MDKLQELTDKLYNEGLSKGKSEGEAILAKAREEAVAIVEGARKQAQAILDKAGKDAAELTSKTESDVKTASLQALQATKNDIENLVVAKMTDAPVAKALDSAEFVKEIITAVAKNFSTQEQTDIALVLPESMKAELEPFVANELAKVLGSNVEASFSKKIAGGFSIGPADGGWFISLTDATFRELIGEYLRPATKKLLFG